MRYYLPKGLTYNLISPDYPAAALAGLKQALIAGINAEPDWAENSAAGPLIRWFEYSHGNVGAGKAWALTQAQNLAPGRPSPFFEALDNAVQDRNNLYRGSGGSTSLAYVEGDIDPEWQEIGRIVLVVLAGGDADVKVVFRFDDPEADCPLDPTKTWNEWGKGSNARDEPNQYGEYWYRTNEDDSQSTNSGQAINASVWVPLMLAGQVTVLSVADYQAIVQANQQGPE